MSTTTKDEKAKPITVAKAEEAKPEETTPTLGAELTNEGLVDPKKFPLPKPEQVEFEATIAVHSKLQARIHELNDIGHETGWRFALVQGGGSSDTDAIVRMKAIGYETVSKSDVADIAKFMGVDIPLQSNETLMKKPYGQFVADKERACKLAQDRLPKHKKGEKIGDATDSVSAQTMDVESKPISLKSA